MKDKLKIFARSVLAGVMISVGGGVYLAVDNKIAGAFLFATGLFAILTQGYLLYTGAIGNAFKNTRGANFDLPLIFVGNYAGAFLFGNSIRVTRLTNVVEAAQAAAEKKISDTPLSLFILAVGCGILVSIAVMLFRTQENGFIRVVGVFFPIAAFVASGFEHCVADMVYFSTANVWYDPRAWTTLLVVTAGNSVGAWIPLIAVKPTT
ncbi:hypothetical protein FACS1894133_6400 [Clostridia bacterium]|nr:hypothetical protein FACS1894133_6400 [Clostridia bacterium]